MATGQTTAQVATDPVAEGREALLAGEKARAQALLQTVVRDDPDNVEAWIWLAGTHRRAEEIAYCLNQVLEREPNNAQALEGMAWLKDSFGPHDALQPVAEPDQEQNRELPAAPAVAANAPAKPANVPAYTYRTVPVETVSSLALVETSAHVAGIGALIGLLRLAAALRPSTMLLLRGSAGPLSIPRGLGLAVLIAALHGVALVVVWAVLALNLARERDDRRGDLFDSLLQSGRVFLPGYLAGAGLVVTAAGLNWSAEHWLGIVAVVWLLIAAATAAMLYRLGRLMRTMRIGAEQRSVHTARILVPALITAIAGLGLAGLAIPVVLRH